MNSDKKLRVVLLRHGKTLYNLQKRLQSHNDSLTEDGKLRLLEMKDELSKFNFDYIISSDEKRAVDSAQILSSILHLRFESTPLIREKSSGNFSDKLVADVDWSIVRGTFLDKKIPCGESVRDVIYRATEFFKKMNEFEQGKSVLVVSHGTFLRVLFCIIFNKNVEDYLLNYEFPNASYIVLNRSLEDKWHVEHSHLIRRGNLGTI